MADDGSREPNEKKAKKEYLPPKVVHTEKVTSPATSSTPADPSGKPGPTQR